MQFPATKNGTFLCQSTYRPHSYDKLACIAYGIIVKAHILDNHSYLDIEDVRIEVQISPVGSTISRVVHSKTTFIHTILFRNFAGESPRKRRDRDPAGSKSTRKVFKMI